MKKDYSNFRYMLTVLALGIVLWYLSVAPTA